MTKLKVFKLVMSNTKPVFMAFLLLLCASSVVAANNEWADLNLNQQQVFSVLADNWNTLKPSVRAKLLRHEEKFKSMSSEQKINMKERFNRWESLPPERKEKLRDRYKNFQKLPPEEKKKINRRMEWFKKLSPEEQEAMRSKWQSLTPEQRKDMHDKFRKMTPEQRKKARKEIVGGHRNDTD